MIKQLKVGFKPLDTNLTDKFYLYQMKKQLAGAAAMGGVAGGALGAGAAYLLAAALNPLTAASKKRLNLPLFDPLSGYYIGRAYKVPLDLKTMQKLHKLITGLSWEPSVPGWLLFIMDPKALRMRNSIRNVIMAGKGNTKRLSNGLLASLVFPAVMSKDRSVLPVQPLFGRNRAPLKGIFDRRPITRLDIQLYLRLKRNSK